MRIFSEKNISVRKSVFPYGQKGKYYAHVICFEKFSGLAPGKYRVVIRANQLLLEERLFVIDTE